MSNALLLAVIPVVQINLLLSSPNWKKSNEPYMTQVKGFGPNCRCTVVLVLWQTVEKQSRLFAVYMLIVLG